LEKEAELVIPIQYRTLMLQGFNLDTVSFEKEVILEFKKQQRDAAAAVLPQAKERVGAKPYNFSKGDRRVDDMWKVTDLSYNIGDTTFSSLVCRMDTKLNNSWAFDIIHYCYNNLGDEYKNSFIQSLVNIVAEAPQTNQRKPPKIDTFTFGTRIGWYSISSSTSSSRCCGCTGRCSRWSSETSFKCSISFLECIKNQMHLYLQLCE
jgi:hypothetical protein